MMNTATNNKMPMHQDQMNHSEMKSLPDVKNAPYDLQFIDTMAAHHNSAILMAKLAMEKAQHQELKNLAQNIIDSQAKEINQIREWRQNWFAGQPLALNMEMPGMMSSMEEKSMQKLTTSTGKDFDLAFIEMMIPHHQGAVAMSKEALERSEHQEIKMLARNIIMVQEAEINSMQEWKMQWSK